MSHCVKIAQLGEHDVVQLVCYSHQTVVMAPEYRLMIWQTWYRIVAQTQQMHVQLNLQISISWSLGSVVLVAFSMYILWYTSFLT